MKRKLVFILFVIGILGLSIGLFKLVSGRSPKQGVLKVNSLPVVSIFLENKHLGKSPFEDKVDAGEYEIKLVPESTIQPATSWQGKINISPNLLTYVNAELSTADFASAVDVLWLEKVSSKQSELTINTNPDGASVTFDSELKGSTPLSLNEITPGDHTILLTSPGFLPRTLKVKTTANYRLMANIKLALSTADPEPENSSASAGESMEDSTPTPTGELMKITPTVSITAGAKTSITPTLSAAVKKPYITISDTPTGFLRVRLEPTTASTEAAQVKPGQQFSIMASEVDSKDVTWYKINYEDDKVGWVSGQYATKVE